MQVQGGEDLHKTEGMMELGGGGRGIMNWMTGGEGDIEGIERKKKMKGMLCSKEVTGDRKMRGGMIANLVVREALALIGECCMNMPILQ